MNSEEFDIRRAVSDDAQNLRSLIYAEASLLKSRFGEFDISKLM